MRPAPADREARRGRPHLHRDREGPVRNAPGGVNRDGLRRRLAPRPSTSWSSPPASGRATSSPATPGWRSASAAASWSTRPAATRRRMSSRSVRWPASTGAPGAWSHPATRWPRSSPTGCSAVPPRSPAPTSHQAQAPRCGRGQLRRRVRHSHRALSRWCTPTRWPVRTRSWSCPTTRRPCLAAYSSATPVPTPPCDRWWARSWARTRPRGCCPKGAVAPPADRPARRRERLLLQQRRRWQHPLCRQRAGLHRPCRRQGVHQGRHVVRLLPAAGEEAGDHGAREVRRDREQRALRALRALPSPALRRRPGAGAGHVQRDHRAPRARPRVRHLPPGVRLHPGQPRPGSRARPRHGSAAGHQRPRDGQPAEGRHLLRRAARPGWRDHARRG